MNDLPKVYGHCDAGCRWEVPHKEELNLIRSTILTINGVDLKFFVGSQEVYDALTAEAKENLLAVITDDKTEEEIKEEIADIRTGLANGTLVPAEAVHATKATQDGDGNIIPKTYAKISALLTGELQPETAVNAQRAKIVDGNWTELGELEEGSGYPLSAEGAYLISYKTLPGEQNSHYTDLLIIPTITVPVCYSIDKRFQWKRETYRLQGWNDGSVMTLYDVRIFKLAEF